MGAEKDQQTQGEEVDNATDDGAGEEKGEAAETEEPPPKPGAYGYFFRTGAGYFKDTTHQRWEDEADAEAALQDGTVRAHLGRLSALSVFHSKSVLYGAFVWACRALNRKKWRFPARAGSESG